MHLPTQAFWRQVLQLADELTRQRRSGDTVYGFAAGLSPTSKPAATVFAGFSLGALPAQKLAQT